ncbi:response regulator [Thermodesulfobacteriota bacterium]
MKKKILVVDDSPQMLEFMTHLLKDEGHEVMTAEDGFSALNMLTVFTPDIMFVDLVMPNIGGDKLCNIVRKMKHLEDCYLVLITAAAAELDFDPEDLGADKCIAKGPSGSIVDHVLSAVDESKTFQRDAEPKSIVGLEDVYSRQMTKELLSQNRHLEAILEGIPDGILEVYSGKIVYANAAAASLCDARQEDLLGTYFIDLFKPVHQQRMKSLLWLGSEKPGVTHPDPVTMNNRQVTVKTFSAQSQASTSFIMITDVTHQNRLEFQQQYSQKMGVVKSLVEIISRIFRKQIREIHEAAAGFFDETEVEHPDLNQIQKVDEHIRKMDDLVYQLSYVRRIETILSENKIESIPVGSETILIVDQTEIISQVNRLILEELGYKVMIARSGNSAVGKYRARSDKKYNRIDLVIVDELLPDMEADELCGQIKEIDSGAKILMSVADETGNIDGSDRMIRVSGFVEKPFNIRKVSSKIREALDKLTESSPVD